MNARVAPSRLSRLLNMVPYFQANPGISAAEAAAELGITTKQLMVDLNQLWMCGLPGYGPGDLIDLSFSEDAIEVTYSAGIDRPLRLSSAEASALIVALHSLVETRGVVDPTAARRALAKIERAAGAAAAAVGGGPDAPTEKPSAAVVRSALARGRALHIVYYSASRDAVTERVVDPIRVLLIDRQSYLEAWSRTGGEDEAAAGALRLFRFDRIDEATELDEPSRPPRQARESDRGGDLFGADAELPVARLRIRADHVWILDQFPMTDVVTHADGSVEATMRY
ncbi:MAG: WYL domain-containing protein, partial [Mycobacteriaceae bacterium]|nr:WYL domain-containing protein [Mycobacteriaceae bacterium]